MEKYYTGIDLGGTTVKIGIFSAVGENIVKWEIPTDKRENGSHILADIAASVKSQIEALSAEGGVLDGLTAGGAGIGVPGPVLPDGTVDHCVNLGWGVFNVADELSEKLGMPVKAANDANVAALGEQWLGGARNYRDAVMVTLGTGVGGGIILDGHILAGYHGAAGEIGHMPVVRPEDVTGVCGCGHVGCLEQAASATGIVNMAERMLRQDSEASAMRGFEVLTAKDVFDCAAAGDCLALAVVEKMSDYLATALACVAAVVNPEVFVIGGGVSKAGRFLLDAVESKYRKKALHACADAEFALAVLGNDAGMAGAARMIMDI